jgi:hypothetical protein
LVRVELKGEVGSGKWEVGWVREAVEKLLGFVALVFGGIYFCCSVE